MDENFFLDWRNKKAPKKTDDAPLADKLERVSHKAIAKFEEVLDLPLDPHAEEFGVLMRGQVASASAVVSTQVQVDRNRLVRETVDRLPELLQIIAEEEAKLAEMRRNG